MSPINAVLIKINNNNNNDDEVISDEKYNFFVDVIKSQDIQYLSNCYYW